MRSGARLLASAVTAICIGAFLHGAVLAQIDPRVALLERAAFDALNRGQAHAAAGAFREAIAADPKNARLRLGAGMAAGQIQYRLGDSAAAIRTYETVVTDMPDDRDARATLDRWRRELELHDRMQQAIGSHFTVSFEGPAEATLAAEAIEILDRAYWRIGELLGTFPSNPIPVVLYTSEQFRDITRSPAWAAAAYDGRIRVPMRGALDNPRELDRVLSHEFSHALIRTLAARGVPTWLNEGLATALETGDLDWAEKRVADASARVPLRTLQSGFGRLSGGDAQVAYATSALAVRRLLDEAGGFAVANLIRDLGQRVDFDTAFLHRIQRSFADFQATIF